jgi:hypothetical protein
LARPSVIRSLALSNDLSWPLVYADKPDIPHFEETGGTPVGPGLDWNIASPVDVLVRDEQGRRIGFDWTTGEVVNDFGDLGHFTGRGTEPAVIHISEASEGTYELIGRGRGNGPYTITVRTLSPDGVTLSERVHSGDAVDKVLINSITTVVSSPVLNTTPPTVTAPSPLAISATDLAGATADNSPLLTAFLVGDAATDDADSPLYRVGPSVDGVAVTGTTLFPLGTTTVTFEFEDVSGNSGTASSTVTVTAGVIDSTAPVITVPNPVVVTTTTDRGAAVSYVISVSDDLDPAPSVACVPSAGALFPIGETWVACNAIDASGNTSAKTFSVTVTKVIELEQFMFMGFFSPVDNPPVSNRLKAGAAVPVKFSLNGNKGLSIIDDGFPRSQTTACDTSTQGDQVEQTINAGSSSLSYDPVADQYTYVWKSDKAWAGTCRQLSIRLTDGSTHVAKFIFVR